MRLCLSQNLCIYIGSGIESLLYQNSGSVDINIGMEIRESKVSREELFTFRMGEMYIILAAVILSKESWTAAST
jgi:hypothetical protein